MTTSTAQLTNADALAGSRRPRDPCGIRRRVAHAVSATTAVLLWSGLVSPAGAEDGLHHRAYDRAVLSDIARDVLRRAVTDPEKPQSVGPGSGAPMETVGAEGPDEPTLPVTHIAPAQEGITVSIPPGFAPTPKGVPELAPAGYRSNTWRQRPVAPRGLTFSSGALTPVGTRPRAEGPRQRAARREWPRVRVRLCPPSRAIS